ncbi:MAG TPA: HK97 family phage prohead protease [Thermodesulfovibrio thiophilus]|nr:HK97 family phage prohead protease [Thermodesulfovibrio thiophilus]
METKDFMFDIKSVEDNGIVEGYAAVFGNKDLGNDIIDPGAFKKTINERKNVPLLWYHQPPEVLGLVFEMEEDNKGLKSRSQINLDTQLGREKFSLIRQGAIKGMSIGFETIKEAWDGTVRRLKEIRLWEISLVTFPMNPLAQVTGIKAVVPYQDLPLADKDREWDAGEARKRLADWAGDDMDKYRKGFLWYDEENADNLTAYKLPIADVIDGRLYAVPRAIIAAAAAIQGARGGVDIPASDVPGVKNHIEKYYKKMDMTPPWKSTLFIPEPSLDTQEKKEPSFAGLIDELRKFKKSLEVERYGRN